MTKSNSYFRLENAREILQEEYIRLKQKQQELEEDRKVVTETAKMLETEKQELVKHRSIFQEEKFKWEQTLLSASQLNSEFVDDCR